LSFNKDVIVDQEVGLFMTSAETKIIEQQPIEAKDSSIKLQEVSLEKGQDYDHEEFLGYDFEDTGMPR
jgi:hypothetical protein